MHTKAPIEAKLDCFSVAQKMSWASKRQTTRVEDIAYCLMGFFGINMPMLYGEGGRAFLRLQEEIMKKSDDHSIFTWKLPDENSMAQLFSGLLARNPREFEGCHEVVRYDYFDAPPFIITNKGIHLQLPLIRRHGLRHPITILNCIYTHEPDKLLGISVWQNNRGFYRYHNYDNDGNFRFLPSIPMITLEKNLPLTSIYAYPGVEHRLHMAMQPHSIEIKGVDEVAHVSETYPSKWLETLQNPLPVDKTYAINILSFTCKNDCEDRFFVAVQRTNNFRLASVGVRKPGETLHNILMSFDFSSMSRAGVPGLIDSLGSTLVNCGLSELR